MFRYRLATNDDLVYLKKLLQLVDHLETLDDPLHLTFSISTGDMTAIEERRTTTGEMIDMTEEILGEVVTTTAETTEIDMEVEAESLRERGAGGTMTGAVNLRGAEIRLQ